MMTIVLAVLLLAAPLDQAGSGGTAAETTASIRGRVMRDDGQPLARAVVSLVIEDVVNGVRTTARTDETGGYVLTKLEAGEYRVSAAKTGYSTREFGQRHAFEHGDVIVLSARERRDHVDIALSRSAAVEGRIVDENNEPIDRTTVSALQVRYKGGRRQLVAVPGVLPRRTNELGRYRVYGLPPGDYFISAEAAARGDNEPAEYATTYFPGAALPEAARVVRVGFEDVAGVDFALAPVTTCRITGRTITSAGVPFQGGIQMRPSRRSGAIAADEVGARSLPDGSFEFTNVAPGEYVLYAFSSVEVAWRYVTVAGTDVSGVEMQTMPGSHITGRVTFEGPDVPAPQDIGLTPVPANPDFAPFVGVANHAEVHDDWSFEIVNVSGPRRLRILGGPPGWSLKAILLNGREIIDDVLTLGLPAQSLKDVEVVMTRQASRISGRVTDDRGAGAAGRAVLAFAVDADKRDEDSRFFGVARSARDGSFDLAGLPPGDYFVVSDRMRDADDWHDPELLEALARSAQRVTLVEAQTVQVTLRPSRSAGL